MISCGGMKVQKTANIEILEKCASCILFWEGVT